MSCQEKINVVIITVWCFHSIPDFLVLDEGNDLMKENCGVKPPLLSKNFTN